jgi:hypothetical protein
LAALGRQLLLLFCMLGLLLLQLLLWLLTLMSLPLLAGRAAALPLLSIGCC